MITCKPHNATFATPATCLARIKLAKKGNGNWGYGGAEDTQQYEACSTCETGRKLMEGIPMEEIKPALVQINAPVEKALQPEDSTHADGEKWCDCPVQGFTVSHSKECKHYE